VAFDWRTKHLFRVARLRAVPNKTKSPARWQPKKKKKKKKKKGAKKTLRIALFPLFSHMPI
jgi:hypothetical protein